MVYSWPLGIMKQVQCSKMSMNQPEEDSLFAAGNGKQYHFRPELLVSLSIKASQLDALIHGHINHGFYLRLDYCSVQAIHADTT